MTSERIANHREQAQTATDEEEDNGTIRCICEYTHDDGFTIQCDQCFVWQHGACVNVRRDSVPDTYYCEECRPRKMDVDRAKEIQKRVELDSDPDETSQGFRSQSPKKKQDAMTNSKSSKLYQGHSFKTEERSASPLRSDQSTQKSPKNGKPATRQYRDTYSKQSNEGDLEMLVDSDEEPYVNDNPTDYHKIEENIIQSEKVEELFRNILSQYKNRKRSLSLSSNSGPIKNDETIGHNDTGSNSSESGKRRRGVDTLQSSSNDAGAKDIPPRFNQTRLDIGNLASMDHQSLALQKTVVKKIKNNGSRCGLFAESNVSAFISEFKGEVCLKEAYKSLSANQYSLLGVAKPFVIFHPMLDLCVDARDYGNEARFIRRSCHPNAETRSIIVPGEKEVHLGIFAKGEILKGKEITVGWDWEPDHPVYSLAEVEEADSTTDDAAILSIRKKMGTIAAATLKMAGCACEDTKECDIYRMQRQGKIKASKKQRKLSKSSEESERMKKKFDDYSGRRVKIEDSDNNSNIDRLNSHTNGQKKRRESDSSNKHPRRTRKIHEDDEEEEEEQQQNIKKEDNFKGEESSLDEDNLPIAKRKDKRKKKRREYSTEQQSTLETHVRGQNDSHSSARSEKKAKDPFPTIDRADQQSAKRKGPVGRPKADLTSNKKGKIKKNSLETPYSRKLGKSAELDQVDSSPVSHRKRRNKKLSKKKVDNQEEESVHSSSSVSSLSSRSNLESSDNQGDDAQRANKRGEKNASREAKFKGKSKIKKRTRSSLSGDDSSNKGSSGGEGSIKTQKPGKAQRPDKNAQNISSADILNISPVASRLPLKKYWVQQYIAMKAASANSDNSKEQKTEDKWTSTEQATNNNEKKETSAKNSSTDVGESNPEGEIIVPRASPIVPAKRVAVTDTYEEKTIHSGGENFEVESKNKRQKIEEKPDNIHGHEKMETDDSFSRSLKKVVHIEPDKRKPEITQTEQVSPPPVAKPDHPSSLLKPYHTTLTDYQHPSKVSKASELSDSTKESQSLPSTPTKEQSNNLIPYLITTKSVDHENEQSPKVIFDDKSPGKGDSPLPPIKASIFNERSSNLETRLNFEKNSKSPEKIDNINQEQQQSSTNTDTASPNTLTSSNAPTKVKLPWKEYQEKRKMEASLASGENASACSVQKPNCTLQEGDNLPKDTMSDKDKAISSEKAITQLKPPASPKFPSTEALKPSSSPPSNDYFPEDLPIDVSVSSEQSRGFSSMDFHSSYDDMRGRRTPPYRDFPSKPPNEYSMSSISTSSFNESPLQTSSRSGYTSPPRGPRYGYSGYFRGGRVPSGPFRNAPISPGGERSRYHGSGYPTGLSQINSLPSTPRQPPLSSASSPYDPANPDGHSSNLQNDRDQNILDNSNNRGSPGLCGSNDPKSREYSRSGERFEPRERNWNYGYSNDRPRERDWRDRERDDRKDWKRDQRDQRDHYYRDYNSGGGSNNSGMVGSELTRYPMDPRRSSGNAYQDRYGSIMGGTRSPISYGSRREEALNLTPPGRNELTEMSSVSSPVPTGPAAGNDPSTSPLQRFGMEGYRRDRR